MKQTIEEQSAKNEMLSNEIQQMRQEMAALLNDSKKKVDWSN